MHCHVWWYIIKLYSHIRCTVMLRKIQIWYMGVNAHICVAKTFLMSLLDTHCQVLYALSPEAKNNICQPWPELSNVSKFVNISVFKSIRFMNSIKLNRVQSLFQYLFRVKDITFCNSEPDRFTIPLQFWNSYPIGNVWQHDGHHQRR